MSILNRPETGKGEAHDDDEGYPRPRIRLAINWRQPRRPFNFDKDYMRLPRFCPDYGRAPMQRRRG